jgi:hypothetical protein
MDSTFAFCFSVLLKQLGPIEILRLHTQLPHLLRGLCIRASSLEQALEGGTH